MPHNLVIPAVGESITEGIVARFLVADGAIVTDATPVFELETDKISTEVQAGAAGRVKFQVKEGDTVPVGGVVAVIDPAGAASPPAPASPAKPSETPSVKAPAISDTSKSAAKNQTLSPAVKKLVADNDIPPSQIEGTGKAGLVTKGDVLAHLAKGVAAPAPALAATAESPRETALESRASSGGTRKRMSALRQRIAQRLVQAQHTAAILTTFNEVDMSACMDLRKRFKEEFEKKHGIGLGFMSFFTAAAVKALQKYPLINSQIDGTDIVSFDHIHVGVAVGTEKGLVVPVLRNAQRMGFADIERSIREAAAKARDGKLSLDDMQGGTFTITNGGVYGSLMSTPIINPPQSGILGMHAIKERPMAVNGQVVIRPMMYIALSYDHRIVDGSEAVGFLVRIKELIEAPEKMLLGL
ncbi:MAG: 2-oxoglutarate dehydrogenase complex dihydrolipoyllysine-residue succinyltransferase [Planctomycetes bacterium]|nr:2-oxoglutarate dehydrogenase complex dihydrolipoyllysine-residue succinyltransferase [Planctomycetota bacterium]